MEISKDLKNNYDNQYSDKSEEWRRIGAKGKVDNIVKISKDLKFNKIIDIGAGDGNVLSVLSNINYCEEFCAAEISDSAIEQMKKKNIKGLKEIRQFDGYTLPFKDKEFDIAICSHVIEHVEFPRQLLREIKRISKYQIFEVPIDFSFNVDKKFNHFNSYGHINIYTPALFNFLLFTEGYEKLNHINALYSNEITSFQFKKTSLKYWKIMLKKCIWKSFPFLMKIKPNTYTVLTK